MAEEGVKAAGTGLKFLTNNVIFLWTFGILAIPIIILSLIGENTASSDAIMLMLISTGVVLIMLFASILLFRKMGERDHKANYILSVNIAIAIYHLVSIAGIFFGMFFNVEEKVFTFIQPIIVLLGTVIAIRYYKLNLSFSKRFIEAKNVFLSISIGIIFGLIFWGLKEPIVYLFSNTIPIFIIYTLFVGLSEELLFRFVIFRLAEKAFAYKIALWLQSIVFAAMHFIGWKYIMGYYSQVGTVLSETAIVSSILYFIALVIFGYVCGKLVGVRRSETLWENGNVVYAIIVHWITNFITLFLFYIK